MIKVNTLKGFEEVLDGYFLSKDGSVYSENKGGFLNRLKIDGYEVYHLKIKGVTKYKNSSVHRLLATAFIDNPKDYPIINHINEIRDDNRVENLEWCTYKHNTNHGTCIKRSKISKNKNPMKVYDLLGNLLDDSLCMRDSTKKYAGSMNTSVKNKFFKGFIFSDNYLNYEEMNKIVSDNTLKPVVMEDVITGEKIIFRQTKDVKRLFNGSNIFYAIKKQNLLMGRYKINYYKIGMCNDASLYSGECTLKSEEGNDVE